MNVLAVFRREWTGRRNVLLLALGIGFIQFLGLHVGTDAGALRDKAEVMTVGTGTGLAWVVAALFGATMVGRDLEERRFGFLLNHPIRLGEILAGKVGAGLGLSLLSGLLVSLPLLLLGGMWREFSLRGAVSVVGVWLAGSLALLLLFHAVSIQVRSRSLWLLLDLLAWSGFVWGARLLSLRLIATEAFEDMAHLWLLLLGVVTLGLCVAGYLQVAQGRADLQRGHRWVSGTMALSLAIALLVGWIHTSWSLAHRPVKPRTQPRAVRIR